MRSNTLYHKCCKLETINTTKGGAIYGASKKESYTGPKKEVTYGFSVPKMWYKRRPSHFKK